MPDGTFRIGVVASETGAPEVDGLSAIKAAFSTALDLPVEVFVARDFAALIEAHIEGRVDYAAYSGPAYAAASIRCGCLRPVAAPLGRSGAVGIRSVLIVRPAEDGGDAGAPRRIAVGPADSLAGRLAPFASWPHAADKTQRKEFVYAGSVGAAEAMFLDGEVDGFFGWILAWPDQAGVPLGGSVERLRQAGLVDADYEIAWQSDLLRHGPHALRADAPEERFERLARLLLGLGSGDPDLHYYLERRYGGGFAAVVQADYGPIIDALEAMADADD